MLECYALDQEVRKGSDAVPFLQHMAKKTLIPEGYTRIPYPDAITPATRLEQAAPIIALSDPGGMVRPDPLPPQLPAHRSPLRPHHTSTWHKELLEMN